MKPTVLVICPNWKVFLNWASNFTKGTIITFNRTLGLLETAEYKYKYITEPNQMRGYIMFETLYMYLSPHLLPFDTWIEFNSMIQDRAFKHVSDGPKA